MKDAFEIISDKYCGDLRELVKQYEYQLERNAYKHSLEVSELKRACNDQVANMRLELVSTKKDLEIYQLKIQMLEMQITNA